MATQIRRANLSDAKAISAIQVLAWSTAYQDILHPDILEKYTDYEVRLVHNERTLRAGGDIFVACQDKRVVAFAAVGEKREKGESDEGELYAIYSYPEVWGSGINSDLLDSALDFLRGKYYRVCWINVLEANHRARRFYEKRNFKLIEEGIPFPKLQTTEARYRRGL